jgi:hypothetical protein
VRVPESVILLGIIRRCRRATPISDALPAKHGSHRAHWIGWLSEYESTGYYGRKRSRPRSAGYIYQHLHCAPMVIWLAELAGVDRNFRAQPSARLYRSLSSIKTSAAAGARRVLV